MDYRNNMIRDTGKVYLVGAGPGDPGLLTLRGAECLRSADVVLYDYLVGEALLAHAPPSAVLICLGKHGQGRLMNQEEVNLAMIAHAREGRVVVRLKGGDPTIFARAGEELSELEAAGVPYEIVPGVSAAQAASSHAGIPLTHRDYASCVALVTGQESATKDNSDELDFEALARFPGTLVFYMGVTTAPKWTSALIDYGKPPETPAAIVRRCSFPDQQIVYTTLGEISGLLGSGRGKMRPPAVVIVGDVARQRDVPNWFTSRPLFARTVLVTRPTTTNTVDRPEADDMTGRLRALGATVLHQPAITIGQPADWSEADAAIKRLNKFDWVVFMSASGVDSFMLRLFLLGDDTRRMLGDLKLAVVGPATEEALLQYYLTADVCPIVHNAEALAEELVPVAAGKRFLLARGSRGREVLADALLAAGAEVEQITVYSSTDVQQADSQITAAMSAGHIHWTTVTSPNIARSLKRLFGEALLKTRLAAISPLTANALCELGLEPAVVAEDYSAEGIVAAISAYENRRRVED